MDKVNIIAHIIWKRKRRIPLFLRQGKNGLEEKYCGRQHKEDVRNSQLIMGEKKISLDDQKNKRNKKTEKL